MRLMILSSTGPQPHALTALSLVNSNKPLCAKAVLCSHLFQSQLEPIADFVSRYGNSRLRFIEARLSSSLHSQPSSASYRSTAVSSFQTHSPPPTSCLSASYRSAAVCRLLPDPLVVVRVPTSTQQSHKPLSFTGQYCLFQCVCVCARANRTLRGIAICARTLFASSTVFNPRLTLWGVCHLFTRYDTLHRPQPSFRTAKHLRPSQRRVLGGIYREQAAGRSPT